ncbi:class I SAM-dependent methyltransferase [Candidatus Gottesmanbacteria bacterium]|nr:class I SAM-dependent methyltransferase [Candidatus Gottesmanbacteria bacterium]
MTKDQKITEVLLRELDPAFARRARFILKHLAPGKNAKILDIGCGRGFYERAIACVYPSAQVTGIDTNVKYLRVARSGMYGKSKISFLRASGLQLPFANSLFDRIICSEVLEHVVDDDKLVKEMFRVLKPGGLVLISVPHTHYPFLWDPLNWILRYVWNTHVPSHIWWLAGIWADHVRLYTMESLRQLLISKKFRVIYAWYATHRTVPFSHFLLYGIGKNLVEHGIVTSGNRFDQGKNSPTWFFHLAHALMYCRDRDNDHRLHDASASVNLILVVKR